MAKKHNGGGNVPCQKKMKVSRISGVLTEVTNSDRGDAE